jgi:hypothetical protein
VIGLAPIPVLIGATMAAAAAVGGAHMTGVVDVPLLPDRAAVVEVPAPSPTASTDPIVHPRSSTAAQVADGEPDADDSTDAGRPSPPPTGATTPSPSPNVAPVPAQRDVAPPTLPDESMLVGTPGCGLGQETAESPPGGLHHPDVTAPDARPDVGPASTPASPVDPCDQRRTPSDPAVASDDRSRPGADVTIPDDVGRDAKPTPAASPPVPTPPVRSRQNTPQPATPPADTAPAKIQPPRTP